MAMFFFCFVLLKVQGLHLISALSLDLKGMVRRGDHSRDQANNIEGVKSSSSSSSVSCNLPLFDDVSSLIFFKL